MKYILTTLILLAQFSCLTAQSFHDPYAVQGDVATIYFKNHADETNAGYPGWTGRASYKNGRITKMLGFWRGQVRFREKYRHKTKDNVTVVTRKNSTDGKWVFRRVERDDGRIVGLVQQQQNDPSAARDSISDIIYDDLGRVVAYRLEYVNLKGEAQIITHRRIDYGKDTIKDISYHKEERGYESHYVLDSVGNPVINYVITRLYDDTGKRQPKKGREIRYEFDERGNWIKSYYQDETGNERLFFTRRIEYTDGWVGN